MSSRNDHTSARKQTTRQSVDLIRPVIEANRHVYSQTARKEQTESVLSVGDFIKGQIGNNEKKIIPITNLDRSRYTKISKESEKAGKAKEPTPGPTQYNTTYDLSKKSATKTNI